MKATLLVFSFVVAMAGWAADSVEAPGKIFYKGKAGAIVDRSATLVVPAKGQGDVFLKAGEKSIKAHAFKAYKSHGRSVFVVVFLNPPGAPKDSAGIFHGTYSRGTNKAIYYGDIFLKKASLLRDSDLNWNDDAAVPMGQEECDGHCSGHQGGQQQGGQCDGHCQGHQGEGQCDGHCQGHQGEGQCDGHCPAPGQEQGDGHPHVSGKLTYVGGFNFEATIK